MGRDRQPDLDLVAFAAAVRAGDRLVTSIRRPDAYALVAPAFAACDFVDHRALRSGNLSHTNIIVHSITRLENIVNEIFRIRYAL